MGSLFCFDSSGLGTGGQPGPGLPGGLWGGGGVCTARASGLMGRCLGTVPLYVSLMRASAGGGKPSASLSPPFLMERLAPALGAGSGWTGLPRRSLWIIEAAEPLTWSGAAGSPPPSCPPSSDSSPGQCLLAWAGSNNAGACSETGPEPPLRLRPLMAGRWEAELGNSAPHISMARPRPPPNFFLVTA